MSKKNYFSFLAVALLGVSLWLIMSQKSNRLQYEQSPYLLQHKDNVVDWYPWSKEAFDKATKENKPIFLSIGYATCHWCHVMEHESFEDKEVGELLNQFFVSIKVDREERPDIDHIYMSVCQMLTGHGGWPLTIIMTPQKKPFFAATYIPKKSHYGRIGMLELLPKINSVWREQRSEVENSTVRIIDSLEKMFEITEKKELNGQIFDDAYSQFLKRFDKKWGGFGERPKFPSPHNLFFLLSYYYYSKKQTALDMVEKTLIQMAQGGVYDHVGFGFHRYSTDSEWLLPHFEKMLYDQALLSMAYLDAYQATRKKEYARIAKEIFTYVKRDMTSQEGGFYSAEDADSEGEEGRFYVWDEAELKKQLSEEEFTWIASLFHIKPQGNYQDEASQRPSGKNIFHTRKSQAELAQSLGVSKSEFTNKWETIRQKLFQHREKRVRPLKDDKILTDWNGLMIAALAKGSRVLDQQSYAIMAADAADFIISTMGENLLWHRYRHKAGILGMLDDYAFFIWGLIELYEATFDVNYLEKAIEYTETLQKEFWDEMGHAFYLTAEEAETPLTRSKDSYDGAIPSGNSVSILNLLRLSRLTGELRWQTLAQNTLSAFSGRIEKSVLAHSQMLLSAQFMMKGSYEIVIVGEKTDTNTKNILRSFDEHFIPNRVTILKDKNSEEKLAQIAPFTKKMTKIKDKTTIYICRDFSCQRPTTEIKEALQYLRSI